MFRVRLYKSEVATSKLLLLLQWVSFVTPDRSKHKEEIVNDQSHTTDPVTLRCLEYYTLPFSSSEFTCHIKRLLIQFPKLQF